MSERRAWNTSKAADPKWSGADDEWALFVSRGEPNRTDEQMTEVMIGQVTRYLAGYTDVTDVDPERLARFIAEDHVGIGVRRVLISRDHLLKYVEVLRARGQS